MKTKICSKCGKELPINMFAKKIINKDGLDCKCKECVKIYKKQYYEKNKDKILAHNKQYYGNNKENIIKHQKLYVQQNKEQLAKSHKKYYESNKEQIKEEKKQYYEKNKEIMKNKMKIYYEKNKKEIAKINKIYRYNNKEKLRIHRQKYRAKKSALPHALTVKQWVSIKQHFDNKCAYCGKELSLVQEHFIPVNKGGEFTKNNIIPACKSCNSSKQDEDFFVWYPKYKYYSKERELKILKYLNYKKGIQQLKII